MGYMEDIRAFVADKTGARKRNIQDLEDSSEKMTNIAYHQLMGFPSEDLNITDLIKERNRFNKLVRKHEGMVADATGIDEHGEISTENLYHHEEKNFWPQFKGRNQPLSPLQRLLQQGKDWWNK
mgnify:CR=1 FL=1|tara:strand:+ start:956 stop:1327 length:372 start_codon:yes stop_codon:yes gene_type:complete